MKISSKVRRWVRDFYDAIANQDRRKQDELLGSPILRDLPLVVAAMDDQKTHEERELLYELANLRPEGTHVLRKHFPTIPESESNEALLGLRDELRQIWPTNERMTDVPRQEVIGNWFGGRTSLTESERWVVLFQFGIIRPAFFRGELAWAFCRHRSYLAFCQNPDCPAPYYVARKRDQQYCSQSEECARYAARKTAREYWRRHNPKNKKRRRP